MMNVNAPNKFTFLIVDDTPMILTAEAALLKGLGHKVITAPNAYHALQSLALYDVDFVFTDIQMAHMNGDELAYLIRRRYPDLPIVAVTSAEKTELELLEPTNFYEVLQKPLTKEKVQAVIGKSMAVN